MQGPDAPLLTGLSGRPPVRFRNAEGAWHNNIDVTHTLGALALPQFGLHQHADGGLTLRLPLRAMAQAEAARTALAALFGSQAIAVVPINAEGQDYPIHVRTRRRRRMTLDWRSKDGGERAGGGF